MQQKATQFIDLLERKQLLAPEIVEELRRQVAEAKTRLTPELLAKLLVDNGHLTKFQATKLIAEAKELSDALPEEAVAPQPAAPSTGSTGTPGDADELGFAPDPEGEIAEESVVDLEEEPPVAAVFIDEEDAGTPEVDAT
ncbi:MAG: serine/threonine protein kinase, partial [Planctomycetota bacterium]